MKISHILPILVLPVIANAEENTIDIQVIKIRPFIEYRVGLFNYTKTNIQQNEINISESHTTTFNYENSGSFVFGFDLDDFLSLSVSSSVNREKTIKNPKSKNEQITLELENEIDTELDIYLTRNTNFKPFLLLNVSYFGMDKPDFYMSNFGFGAGLGFRQYINQNVYLGAGIMYLITPKIDIKRVEGVNDLTVQMSGVDFQIGIGYKF